MNICRLNHCNKPVMSLSLCNKHYEWSRKHPGQEIKYKEQRDHEFHGKTHTQEWQTWLSMNQRCHNPNSQAYEYYGGRGIVVCDEWRTSFIKFYEYMGDRPEGMSIDRINNDKGYQPGNVRWASRSTQIINRRMNSNNHSGTVGVSWNNKDKKWHAELYRNGTKVLRKKFVNLDDAIKARKEAEKLYN